MSSIANATGIGKAARAVTVGPAPDRSTAMMVVVFRARRSPEGEGALYKEHLDRMVALATKMPGYVSHKAYIAEDGERLTFFQWETAETLRAWATHPDHVATKKFGRQHFYAEYHLQVCEVVRESTFTRPA
jgi:heme-degrading monooxygenase HmoA